jgi:predicted esterase
MEPSQKDQTNITEGEQQNTDPYITQNEGAFQAYLQEQSTPPKIPPQVAETLQEKSPIGFWLGILLMVIAAGGVIYFMLNKQQRADPMAYHFKDPIEYYFYVPKNYTPDHAWPLFIGIHGTGGNGRDCWNMWQEFADREGYLLLCPSLSDLSGGWYQSDGENKLNSVLYKAIFNYQVEKGYFLVGFSAGGQFVQGYTFNHPKDIKAVSAIAAGLNYTPSEGAVGIPFQIIIGSNDNPETIALSKQLESSLINNHSSVDYQYLEGVGHEVTNETRAKVIEFFKKIYSK